MTAAPRPGPIAVWRDKSYWSAFLLGIASMAAVDEIVFHQLLHWHHFYDAGTPELGLLSDGLLHAGELLALVAGFFLMADARRRNSFSARLARAGFCTGAGLFQFWDGIVDHKVLRVHQIRYGVELGPYDLAWNAFAVLLLALGGILAVRSVRRG
jgi:uncharacterized membrane protein